MASISASVTSVVLPSLRWKEIHPVGCRLLRLTKSLAAKYRFCYVLRCSLSELLRLPLAGAVPAVVAV